jgi:hypothetical protein
VDNNNQQSSKAGLVEYYSSLPGYDYVVGSHQAYSGVKVQRSIFFSKPSYWIISDLVTGIGSHTYDVNYHLEPALTNTVILDSSTHTATTPLFGLYPADSVQTFLLSGWVSDNYNVKMAAPVLQQKRSGVPPVAFESIIVPYSTVKPVISVARQPVMNGTERTNVSQATCLKITVDGRMDWYYKSNMKDVTLQFGSFSCDARTALIGIAVDGSISNIQIADGTVLFKDDSLLFDSQAVNTSISYGTASIYAQSDNAEFIKIWSPGYDSLVLNGTKVPTRKENGYLIYEKSTSVAVSSKDKDLLHGYTLVQNYPNPFNPSTVIQYTIPRTCNVSLVVHNVLGQVIKTLVNEYVAPGTYSVQWHGRTDAGIQVASGVYFYTLRAGDCAKTQRMILMK